jgi:hypothetical protein
MAFFHRSVAAGSRSNEQEISMTAARSRRSASLAGTALVALAADFQIEDVRIDLGKMTLRIPKVAVKGSNLEKDAFLALFSSTANEPASMRAAKLTAAEISAPELTMEQSFGEQKQSTTYRDIRLTDIRDGKIAHGESASGSITAQGGPTGPMKGTLKRTAFDALDLKQTTRVLTEKAAPGTEEPYLPLIEKFEQEGYDLDLGKGGTMSIGRTTGRNFAAKVGPEPMLEVIDKLGKASAEVEKTADAKPGDKAAKAADDEAHKRLALSALSLFDSVDYGSGEVRDITMRLIPPPKPGKAAGPADKARPDDPVDMKIARMAFGEDTAEKSGFAMEGMQFASGPVKGRVDLISYSGFSFANSFRELRAVLAEPNADIEHLDFRRFVPKIGTVRFAGVAVDAPPAKPSEGPFKVALGTFELRGGEQLNGVPTSMGLTIDKLVAPIVPTEANPALKDLVAMGITSLDFSAKLDLAWDAVKNELGIKPLAFGAANLARIDANATLGNVTKDLFASDLALAQVAALGATARQVEIKLQNFGLIEKLIENEARKSKRKVEEVRQQYSMMATMGLAAILGPSEGAKTLASAVSRFVAKPGTLTVQASAKSSSGLGLADVLTITQPAEIFDKIDIKADAQ